LAKTAKLNNQTRMKLQMKMMNQVQN